MSTMHILSAGIGMCPLDEGFESLNNQAQVRNAFNWVRPNPLIEKLQRVQAAAAPGQHSITVYT